MDKQSAQKQKPKVYFQLEQDPVRLSSMRITEHANNKSYPTAPNCLVPKRGFS